MAIGYVTATGKQYFAARLSSLPDLASLQRAAHLEPHNAEYPYLIGRYFWLVQQDTNLAATAYRSAVALNPHNAAYWFDLAGVYQMTGNISGQRDALEHAVWADPTTPQVAWEAANFYIVQGDSSRALREFRVVLDSDPDLWSNTLALCWRIQPDLDVLLRDVLPPNSAIYSLLLHLLVSKNELAAADKLWGQLVGLGQPVTRRYVFGYIKELLSNRETEQAERVWRQSATLSKLSAYQPTSENLIVNGDFSLDVLNGGFDWLYTQSHQVSLALDPTQAHTSHRSLLITFDARRIEDAGIRQIIPVQANTAYEFSAYFKAQDIECAGGPRFLLQDLYEGTIYFVSEDLSNADFWKQVNGRFTTNSQTKLLVLRVQKEPAMTAIKGKLWIDGLRLVAKKDKA